MKRPTFRRGSTLPEVVIVASLLVVVLTGIVTVGVNASAEWSIGSSKVMADDSASLALQAIAADVRNGVRASVDSSGTQLTVVMPLVNCEGDYERYQDGSTVTYFLSNGMLYRRVGTANPTVLGRRISAVRFTMRGSQVEITVTSRQQMGTRVGESTFRTQATLRNEPS